MKTIQNLVPYFIITTLIFGAVIGLIWVDYETTSWSTALEKQNLINGFIFYALPALLLSFLIFSKIHKPLGKGLAIIVSLVLGVPISFFAVIFSFFMISIFV
ncbi:MAG: hypothetical protein KAH25_09160 [Bacteroidales bacterium]|nr:hypothetical protein [Bacteroidales bacterium]